MGAYVDPKHSYRIQAAQYLARAQAEPDPLVRAALEDLARDYLRLAEGRGSETALTVDVQMEANRRAQTQH